MDLKQINEKVFEVYKECDIHSFPIDCFAILEHYGIRTITYCEVKEQNPELFQAISNYSKDAFRFRMSVYYNSCNTIGRIRFSLMHELGHYILRHTEESADNENAADCFASHMIAPRVAIEKYKCTTADHLHEYFGLSYTASNRTLSDYHKWKLTDRSRLDNRFSTWIFDKDWYIRSEQAIKRLQKERRKLQKELKFEEERSIFLAEHCDMFARAEHYHLYGDDL